MYSRFGIHLLQPAPDDFLLALNPQVLVYACAWENQSADTLNKYRNYASHLVQLLPNTVIGIRWWPDDNILLRFTPQEYADNFFKLHVPGTILMIGNEDNPNDYTHTVDLHNQICKLATAQNIPVGVCCTSMLNPTIDKYPVLQTLFDTMAVARTKGVTHWWRPNTYSTVPFNTNAIQQHIREAKKLKNFPPTFYGEFSFIKSLGQADQGPIAMGMSGADFVKNLQNADIPVPQALYCWGDGIYGNEWRWFNLQSYRTSLLTFPKTNKTAYQEWSNNMQVEFKCPTQKKINHTEGLNLRSDPSKTGKLIRLLKYNEVVTVYTLPQIPADNYFWQKVTTMLGETGYCASAAANVASFADIC